VVGFEAEIETKTIVGDIKAKDEARKEYAKAVKQDKNTAFLLEEKLKDLFQIKLGQLKPGSAATIKIKLAGELPVAEGDKIALTIPTTIAPRYVPQSDNSDAAKTIASMTFSKESPATLDFQVTARFQSPVTSINCVSHPAMKFQTDKTIEAGRQVVTYTNSNSTVKDMDRDIVVHIEHEDMDKPWLLVEGPDEQGDDYVAMLSLVPSFQLSDQLTIEAVFLLDRSGSMGGSSIQRAKQAMQLFLHSLPSNCRFNIWSFGSNYSSLYPESQPYDDDSLARAKEHVMSMGADYGGTEIYQPLKKIFDEKAPARYHRQVFVLTDGQVSNSPQVVELVRKNANQVRLFSMGIGSSASRFLVKGIARAGKGSSVFAIQSEDLRPKVMNLLKDSMQPALSDIKCDWETAAVGATPILKKAKTFLGYNKPLKAKDSNCKRLTIRGQVPMEAPPIFDGSRLLLYCFLDSQQAMALKTFTLSGNSGSDGKLTTTLPLSDSSFLSGGSLVHKLAARKRIQELEEDVGDDSGWHSSPVTTNWEEIKKIGLEYGLVTSQTSFVGVDKETRKPLEEQLMVLREVPNQFSLGGGFQNHIDCMVACSSVQYFQAQQSPATLRSAMPRLRGGGPCPSVMEQQRCHSPSTPEPITETSNWCSPGAATFQYCQQSLPDNLPEDDDEDDDMGMELFSGLPTVSMACAAPTIRLATPPMTSLAASATNKAGSVPKDNVTAIIDLQSSKGSFKWGPGLEQLGLSQTLVKDKRPAGTEETDWLTALAVCLIESKMADQKELLELIVEKAVKFLKAKMTQSDQEAVMEHAKKVVDAI